MNNIYSGNHINKQRVFLSNFIIPLHVCVKMQVFLGNPLESCFYMVTLNCIQLDIITSSKKGEGEQLL